MGSGLTARSIWVFTLLLMVSPPARAYIDPGILGSLFQMAYIAIFGLVAAVIFRPLNFLKNLWRGKKPDAGNTAHPNAMGEGTRGASPDAETRNPPPARP